MTTAAEKLGLKLPTITWAQGGKTYRSKVTSSCPLCGELAVVKLPGAILKVQPDDTTHVCLGCNHGFAID